MGFSYIAIRQAHVRAGDWDSLLEESYYEVFQNGQFANITPKQDLKANLNHNTNDKTNDKDKSPLKSLADY